jgi:integrase
MRYYVQGEGQRKRVQKFLGTFDALTKPQAKHAMTKALLEVNEHPVGQPQTKTLTFAQFAERWIDDCEQRKQKPIKASVAHNWNCILTNHLNPIIGELPLSDVGNRTMKSVVERLTRKGLAPATIRNIMLVVKLVRASAVSDDGDQLFPVKWNSRFIDAPQVDPAKQRKPTFTGEQVTSIVKAATGRMQIAAILFAATGLRAGELLGLEVRHFDGESVKVEQSVWGGNNKVGRPKTANAYRTVDLHPDVTSLLQSFIGKRKSGFILQTRSRKPVTQTNLLRRELHPLLTSLGVSPRGFHAFRRYRNTFLRQSRCPDGLLKFWMGHANASMSDLYDKSSEDLGYRRDVARAMGVGFELPKALTAKPTKGEKTTQSGVNARLEETETAEAVA